MIGKVVLNEKQIKKYLEIYYKKIYGDVKISFRDIDYCPNDTGIVLERKLLNDSSSDLIIDEYLENDCLIEAFNSIFESDGYVVKELYPDINRRGSGWSECVSLNSLKLTLEKENVKKKVRENVLK